MNKMKKQPSEQEKIFANEAMDKGSISKYINNSRYSNIKKQASNKKRVDLNRHFSKEEYR